LHSEDDIAMMAETISGVDAYYLQGYVSSKDVLNPNLSMGSFDVSVMYRFRDIASAYVSHCYVRL